MSITITMNESNGIRTYRVSPNERIEEHMGRKNLQMRPQDILAVVELFGLTPTDNSPSN